MGEETARVSDPMQTENRMISTTNVVSELGGCQSGTLDYPVAASPASGAKKNIKVSSNS